MSRLSAWLTRMASSRPAIVLIAVLAITVTLGSFIPQAELSNDSTAFSPDSDEVAALNDLRDRFDDSSTATLQMVVTGDDVISGDGVRTAATIVSTAQTSFGDALVRGGQPPIVTFADPATTAAASEGVDLATVSDDEVDRLQQAGLATFDPARADLAATLSAGDDVTATDAGLVVIQLDRAAFDDDEALVDAQRSFIDDLEAADAPLDANPFSLELVRAPDDSFQQEVAQLFALAAVIILVVLASVLRARRGPALGRVAAIRRSAADMGLSIGAVVTAIVWVQGLGVLLGPNYVGIVGEPTPPTQIVPILLLALGVDYAIHTHGRYREELVATPDDPRGASARLGTTVGVALTLSMITTGIGFLTNLASPLPAIQDLGVTAAVGIFCVFVTILTIVVAGRTLLDRRAERRGVLAVEEIEPSEASIFARVATVGVRPALTAPLAVLGVTGVVTIASAVGFTQLETEFSATDFLPDGDPSKAAVVALEESFDGGLGETTDVLVTGDAVLTPDVHNATALVTERLVDRDGIVDRLGQPDMVTPPSELATAQRLADGPVQTEAVQVARSAGLLDDGTIAADGDVALIYATMAESFPNVDAVVDLGSGAGDLAEPAIRLSVLTQSEAFGVDTVVEAMDAALEPLLATGVEATATSDAIINDQTTTAMSDSSVSGLLITLAAVTLLLAAVYWFRSRQAGLGALVVAPVAAVVLNTFGLMWLFGIPFDPITAIMSSLVVGVGVDFCIHLGERFVEDLELADGDIATALRQALRHTGAALAGSATTTTLGFAVLLFGSILPFQRLGLVTIFAMVLSSLAVIFVLPAALVLYGRRVGTERRPAIEETTAEADELAAV